MDRTTFLSALRARYRIFVASLVLTVAAATVMSLIIPKSYQATASIVVDTRNEQSLSDALNVLVSSRERLGYIQTQVDIITSPKVARKVVDDLSLAARPGFRSDFEDRRSARGAIEDWLAEKLLRKLEVETSQSSVIDVNFFAEDPEFAAQVANAFAQAYMDTMLELRVEPTRQAAAWFDEQLKTLRTDLERAQSELTDYQQRHGIVSANEQVDIEHARLAGLSTQLLDVQGEKYVLRGREQQVRRAVNYGASLEDLPEVLADEHIQELRAALREGEARLRSLSTQFGVNHPDYRRQVAENRSRRQELDTALNSIVAATENMGRENTQRETEIRAALDAQRERLLSLKETRDELGVLAGNVEVAQRAYDTAMQRFVVNQVESRASQTNVALLNPAVAPTIAHRPNIPLNIILSIAVGSMLGVGLIVLLEMSDRRVRSVRDFEFGENIPLLGVLNAWTPPDTLLLPAPPTTPGAAAPA